MIGIMTQRIDLETVKKPVRDFINGLGQIRGSVELFLADKVVAKIVPPEELSEAEKESILQKG